MYSFRDTAMAQAFETLTSATKGTFNPRFNTVTNAVQASQGIDLDTRGHSLISVSITAIFSSEEVDSHPVN